MSSVTLRNILLLVATLFTGAAQGATQTPISEVTYVASYRNLVAIRLASTFTSNENCTGKTSESYVLMDIGPASGNEGMYAMFISAYLAGKRLSFGTSGCLKWGPNTRPKVYRVDVR